MLAEQKKKLEKIKDFIELMKNATFEECVKIARNMFQDYYYNNILQFLYNFPVDCKNQNGTPFWSGSKKAPTPCVFDTDNNNNINKRPLAKKFLLQFILPIKVQKRHEYLTKLRYSLFFQALKLHNESNSPFLLQQSM